ncbi:hypothetical protein MTO96_011898 [Rhipicephalus appendiculatus]
MKCLFRASLRRAGITTRRQRCGLERVRRPRLPEPFHLHPQRSANNRASCPPDRNPVPYGSNPRAIADGTRVQARRSKPASVVGGASVVSACVTRQTAQRSPRAIRSNIMPPERSRYCDG